MSWILQAEVYGGSEDADRDGVGDKGAVEIRYVTDDGARPVYAMLRPDVARAIGLDLLSVAAQSEALNSDVPRAAIAAQIRAKADWLLTIPADAWLGEIWADVAKFVESTTAPHPTEEER